MMKSLRIGLALALALLVAAPLAMAEKKDKPAKAPRPTVERARQAIERIDTLRAAVDKLGASGSLTEEQKRKLAEIQQEVAPKSLEVMASLQGILTDEQRKAAEEAAKAAKEAGKTRRQIIDAALAALKLTDEQLSKLEEPLKKLGALQKELLKKVSDVLTDEQRQELKKMLGGDQKKPAKGAAKDKAEK